MSGGPGFPSGQEGMEDCAAADPGVKPGAASAADSGPARPTREGGQRWYRSKRPRPVRSRPRRLLRHGALILLEGLAGLLGVAAIGGGLLAWRLQQGPLEIDWLTPYVEQELNREAPVRLAIGRTALSWSGFGAPLDIRAGDLTAFGQSGEPLASIPELNIALSLPALLRGRVAPTRIELVEPSLAAIRTEEGEFRLDIRQTAAPAVADEGDQLLEGLVEALRRPPDPTDPLGALTELRITRADLRVENRQTGTLWTAPGLSLELVRDADGVRGAAEVTVDLGGRPNRLTAQLDWRAEDQGLSLRTHLVDVRPADFGEVAPVLNPLRALEVAFAGTVTLELDGRLAPQSLSIDLTGGPGALSLPDHLPEPVALQGVRLKGLVDGAGQHLRLEEFILDLGRPKLAVTGDMTQQGDRLEMALVAELADMPMADLPRYWPAGVSVNVRDWMVANMADGTFDRTRFVMEATSPVDRPQALTVTRIDGRFALSGFTLHYRPPLPPLTGVSATATLDAKAMDIQVQTGRVFDLTLADGRVRIYGLDTPYQGIDIRVPLSGPLRDALTLLDHEPLGYPGRIGLDPATTAGQADMRLHFAFPLIADLAMEDVELLAEATVADVAIPDVVAGIDATDGMVQLAVTGQHLDLSGTVLLNGVPATVEWREEFADAAPIGTSVRVQARPDDAERGRFGLDFPDWLNGPVGVDLTYLRPARGRDRIEAQLDLTPSVLRIDLMDWQKPAGEEGEAELTVEFIDGRPVLLPRFTIATRELAAGGRLRLWPDDYAISRLELETFRLGETTDARLQLTRTRDGAMTIAAIGPAFDARPFLGRSDRDRDRARAADAPPAETPEETEPTLPLDLAFDLGMVTTAEGRSVRGVAGTASQRDGHWYRATVDAVVGEGSPLKLRYWPEGQSLLLTLESEDAGAVLRDLDLLDWVRGGRLLVTGRSDPSDPKRTVAGRIKVTDYQVKDAPALARLLSAASPRGFADFLSGAPLAFSRLEGEYFWHDRGITFRDLRTSGNAVGLTVEGEVDVVRSRIDLQGTVVPFSTVNRLLGAIPVLGDLLVGGEGQGVFAATYGVRGPAGDPQITVNPLAILTPGFLRNLFFLGQPAGEAGQVPKDQPVPGQDGVPITILPAVPSDVVTPAVPPPVVETAPLPDTPASEHPPSEGLPTGNDGTGQGNRR